MPRLFGFEPLHAACEPSNLRDFGTPVHLFNASGGRPSIFDPALIDAIHDALIAERFDPAVDAIASTFRCNQNGLYQVVAVACAMFGEINLIAYDFPTKRYRLIKVGLPVEIVK